MGRAPNKQTFIKRELDRSNALPEGHSLKFTREQVFDLLKMMESFPQRGGAKKGNRPPNTGKIKKPSRNLSEADIARLRGNEKPKPAPQSAGTLGEFLKDENQPES